MQACMSLHRRKDLKQAVHGLRNQLMKKPRRLTTKAVLEAAQIEIRVNYIAHKKIYTPGFPLQCNACTPL